jgi:hypothetical protein
MDAQEIAERLRVAAEAVEAADLPESLQQVAFEHALSAVGLAGTKSAPAGDADEAAGLHQRTDGGADGGVAAIAERLGVDVELVERVYENDEEVGIRLILKRSMLPEPQQKAASMRHVALLVAVGRQVSGLEDYTPLALMRDECSELRVLDPSNFSTEVGKLGMRRRGSRNKQEAKINRHHLEEAAELIRRIASQDS